MSSKKIWAASLAAVIAGSTFAVVASAATTSDKQEITPGNCDVNLNGEIDGTKVDFAATSPLLSKADCKVDGSTVELKPTDKAYGAESTKINLTVKLTNEAFANAVAKVEGADTSVTGNVITLTIKDFDLKATAGKSTDYTVTVSKNNEKDKTVKFTVKNTGEFTDPTLKFKNGKHVTKIDDSGKKEKDTIIVVYDADELTTKKDYDDIEISVSGTGSINGKRIDADQDISYKGASTAGYKLAVPIYFDDLKNDVQDMFAKKIDVHFVSEEEYNEMNDLPADKTEDSKPADESKDESTSSDTVVEKEVKVDVVVGDVTDAGLVLDPAKIFTGDAATASWADVQEIKFTSDKPFALVFSVEKGAVKDKADAETFTKGVDAYKALDKAALATEQTLTAEDAAHVAKSTAKTVTLQTAEGETATVKATVKVKVKTTDTAPNTGIALAIAPAALATAFVTVAAVMSKKKKG